MSRSYQKISAGKRWNWKHPLFGRDIYSDIDPSIPAWSHNRMKEKRAIHDELTNAEYGDALFPQYRGLDRSSWFSIPRWHPLVKEYIRDRYFCEIHYILNGFVDDKWRWKELFMEEFQAIKGIKSDSVRRYHFEWLNLKAVRKAIKAWTGEPLDVLRYLTLNGFIERAVCREFKMIISK